MKCSILRTRRDLFGDKIDRPLKRLRSFIVKTRIPTIRVPQIAPIRGIVRSNVSDNSLIHQGSVCVLFKVVIGRSQVAVGALIWCNRNRFFKLLGRFAISLLSVINATKVVVCQLAIGRELDRITLAAFGIGQLPVPEIETSELDMT